MGVADLRGLTGTCLQRNGFNSPLRRGGRRSLTGWCCPLAQTALAPPPPPPPACGVPLHGRGIGKVGLLMASSARNTDKAAAKRQAFTPTPNPFLVFSLRPLRNFCALCVRPRISLHNLCALCVRLPYFSAPSAFGPRIRTGFFRICICNLCAKKLLHDGHTTAARGGFLRNYQLYLQALPKCFHR